jgi:hypothetical protein
VEEFEALRVADILLEQEKSEEEREFENLFIGRKKEGRNAEFDSNGLCYDSHTGSTWFKTLEYRCK